jgi:hypothetical protein
VEFDFALLADRASETPEGKLDIIGAGFDTIVSRQVPTRHPRMGLAIRFVLEPAELAEEHRVEIILRERVGDAIPARAEILVPPMPDEQRAAVADERQDR